MSKARFFVLPEQIKDDCIIMNGSDVNHTKNVLRLKVGNELIVSDNRDFEYDAEILELSSSMLKVRIYDKRRIQMVPFQVVLFQAIPKGAKMDTIIRQATELGVSSIVPIVTSRTVVILDEKKKGKKHIRWQKIAKEAAEQSQRSTIPKVVAPTSWDEALRMILSFDLVIAFWEEASELFSGTVFDGFKADLPKSCGIIIGPEGGFSSDEIEDLVSQGAHCLSLGKQILRTETASTVALGIFFYELGKLSDSRA